MGIEIGSYWVWTDGSRIEVDSIIDNDICFYDDKGRYGEVEKSRFLGVFKPFEQGCNESADMVNHPPHYKDTSGIECIEVTRHMRFLVVIVLSIFIEQAKKAVRLKIWKKPFGMQNKLIILKKLCVY